ncbi:hypothetical protein HDU85_003618 [Gaertneriomyces sp. JEL0708]|nr:hypothetical protein HDU85_003618 [Gaertneriomyces sp. JEL0708]
MGAYISLDVKSSSSVPIYTSYTLQVDDDTKQSCAEVFKGTGSGIKNGWGFDSLKLSEKDFHVSVKFTKNVVITLPTQSLHLSKLQLASFSEYFKALLLGDWSDSTQAEVDLTDVDAWAMEQCLRWIYDFGLDLDPENLDCVKAFRAYTVAKRFLVKNVEEIISEILEQSIYISRETYHTLFMLAESYDYQEACYTWRF